ncbi:hypothetical protein GIW56_26825 [Pseudomonas gessardii]|uniref:DUF3102 domain-containing protein n=1 Tax=Pseudomonas gessardii TaxID=78544 RepID=A0ABS9FDJ7_9PSED|nr:hypothetical protein [Pseudomonas gessardii]MCF4982025.1 hypothetical protein [Pseudomonas gessardii]MCF4993421.1 hypothetical protein [Pseudomonas gessardii]MCF5097855.1 hypothetical protein [Pseudomonas gessardii]MCF5110423.1 hypothetical protein [Pseudomonas gessardii]
MARAKNQIADPIELPALDGEMLTATQNSMATAMTSHSEERDIVNQLLGQAQMADSIGKFTATVAVSKMAYVKEHKLYRGLAGMHDRDGRGLSGTWEEFCSLLGTSAPKVNEDINNLRQFGEDALESMSRMGIGYREMRQYRRLPEDAQAALIEVAKAGDKDAFVDLAEEIIAKHAKEKAELTQRLDEVNADYDAQGEVMAKKAKELDSTKQELEKHRKRIQTATPDEVIKELRTELVALQFEVEAKILGELREGFSKMAEHATDNGQDHRAYQADLILQLETTLATVRSEFHLPHHQGANPVWMDQVEA